jgi:hypothetical protein
VEDLRPEEPSDAGVEERVADAAHEEGARILADEASARLAASGFTDEQIRRWAEVFVATEGSGDPEEFIAWIVQQEHGS